MWQTTFPSLEHNTISKQSFSLHPMSPFPYLLHSHALSDNVFEIRFPLTDMWLMNRAPPVIRVYGRVDGYILRKAIIPPPTPQRISVDMYWVSFVYSLTCLRLNRKVYLYRLLTWCLLLTFNIEYWINQGLTKVN